MKNQACWNSFPPPKEKVETKAVLKQAMSAHRVLGELKGASVSIPNQGILINVLPLQEASKSSAIENIITTQDELFKETLFPSPLLNAPQKEVSRYGSALRSGFERTQKKKLLTLNDILEIHKKIKASDEGFRINPGTIIADQYTRETIFKPPQKQDEIKPLLTQLEHFINADKNDENFYDVDSLIKMALIHHQFETIHPFSDGNGRTGRIINILYLVKEGLLDIPVLYLSRYIIEHKADYYSLLQEVRDKGIWENWVLFMLQGVEETARDTLKTIIQIKECIQSYKHIIRNKFKFYSQDLINSLFKHPYTKIEFMMNDLNVSRLTATKYLDQLAIARLLEKKKMGRSNYYINVSLIKILG